MTESAASPRVLPERPVILFAHPVYQLQSRFAARGSGLTAYEVRTLDVLRERIAEADVLIVSGLWRNELLAQAPRLGFVQSISAGTDQYDRAQFAAHGVRLASAQGVNERAVAQHAIALMLAVARKLPQARDHQAARFWRGMIAEVAAREDELTGKTLIIVGLGRIGLRLARLARAFEMRVIGVKRDPTTLLPGGSGGSGGGGGSGSSGGSGGDGSGAGVGAAAPDAAGAVDRVVATSQLHEVLAEADYVALTCPLTPATVNLIDRAALAAMPRHAVLINVARGRVVDQTALIEALEQGRIGAAAIDCAAEEPLPAASPLWSAPNLLITPHTAGETRRYEDSVIELLVENLARLRRSDPALVNRIV
ncbi:MAG: D-2-hydroxyacid dehydrogenase [Lautropia sp.]